MKRGADRPSDASKSERVIQVLQQVRSLRDQGVHLDEEGILSRHPGLESGLKRGLEHLRRIKAAAEAAMLHVSDPPSAIVDQQPSFPTECFPAYEVGERVRYGGQGVVYRAIQRSTGLHVAIKLLLFGRMATQREQRRFEREAEILSRLKHSNIVSVCDSGVVDGRHFVVMEFIDGVPIDTFVVADDLTIRDTVRLFISVCRAIEYAHQRGVIHRDIKPDNIIVNAKGRPFVLDFGLAKDVTVSAAPITTAAGERVGTPAYFSPEQAAESDSDVDVRSDVYSLGVTLFVLIAQDFPYPVEGTPSVIRRIVLDNEPLPLRAVMPRERPGSGELNDDLERIVRKALAKEKGRRYGSVRDLADDLERYLSGEAVHAKADSAIYVLRKTIRRYRVLTTTAALICLTLAVATVMTWRAQRQTALERDRAQNSARLAYGLFDKLAGVAEDRLSTLAGGLPIREQFLHDLNVELPRFLELLEPDPAMRDLEAALREKQGDLALDAGRHADARRHYEAFRKLTAAGSLERSRSLRKLGRVTPDFDAQFGAAVEIAAPIAAAPSASLGSRLELSEARLAYGRRLLENRRDREASLQIDAAIETLEGADGPATADVRLQRDLLLATAYSMRADRCTERGQGSLALRDSRAACDLRRAVSRREPANVEVRHALLVSLTRLAELSPDEARALYREAVDCADYLLAVEPRVEWLVDIHGLFVRAARHLLDRRQYDPAEAYAKRALDVADLIVQETPDAGAGPRLQGYALDMLGRIAHAQGRWNDAMESLEAALQCWERVTPRSTEIRDAEAVASTHEILGNSLLRVSRSKEAIRHMRAALALLEAAYGPRQDLASTLALTKALINLAGAEAHVAPGPAPPEIESLLARAEWLLDRVDDGADDPSIGARRAAVAEVRMRLAAPAATP